MTSIRVSVVLKLRVLLPALLHNVDKEDKYHSSGMSFLWSRILIIMDIVTEDPSYFSNFIQISPASVLLPVFKLHSVIFFSPTFLLTSIPCMLLEAVS
jgi:hypothetical protein